MSQTLAQRRVLAAHARLRPEGTSDRSAAGWRPLAPPGPADRADASRDAMQTVLVLVRSGARIVSVEPARVVLDRDGRACEVDRAGRVRWS
jgi:hypothetical protein